MLSVPIFPEMTDEQVDRVIAVLRSVVSETGNG
jgi:dTDP-4-amino-4,6-dideoxygalactose transaminase